MNILIINGTPKTGWEEYETRLDEAVGIISGEHDISHFRVRDMDINFCTGCFGCWTKTPGKCIYRDGMDEILSKYPSSDMLIFITPLITGFLSALTKKTMDRMIPIVLPYIKLFDGECHHPQRYENNPSLGLILYGGNSMDEAVGITFDTLDRLSLNFHANRTFKKTVGPEEIKEVLIYEISNH
ncbi:MAG: flavodoxin family protein [Clostridia bacterium]|nr:flavodoxin family protein [Clostridia bacterium]MBN2882935.1 flavodoxin family protein [Clostridia bacterium]